VIAQARAVDLPRIAHRQLHAVESKDGHAIQRRPAVLHGHGVEGGGAQGDDQRERHHGGQAREKMDFPPFAGPLRTASSSSLSRSVTYSIGGSCPGGNTFRMSVTSFSR